MRNLICIALLIISSRTCIGQTQTIFSAFQDELPSQSIWCTYQDKLGYLWIATSNGLCRYNGLSVDIYNEDDGLWSKNVTWLSETDDGDLLTVSFGKGFNVINIEHNPTITKIRDSSISDLNFDSYLVDSNIFNRQTLTNFKRNNSTTKSGLNSDTKFIHRLFKLSEDVFLYNTDSQVFSFDTKNNKSSIVFESHSDSSFHGLGAFKNKTYIGARGKVYLIENNKLKAVYENGLPDERVTYILEDSKGDLLACIPGKGLFKYSERSQLFEKVEHSFFLKDAHINHLFQDKNNNVWISTWGQGLFCLQYSPIINYQRPLDIDIGKINNIHLMHPNNKLLINSFGGIYYFEEGKLDSVEVDLDHQGYVNVNKIYSSNNKVILPIPLSEEKRVEYCQNTKTDINYLRRHNVYCFSPIAGVYQFEKSDDDIHYYHYKFQNDSLFKEFQFSLPLGSELLTILEKPYFIDEHKLFQATTKGLLFFDRKEDILFNSNEDTLNYFPSYIRNAQIEDIKSINNDSIWFNVDKTLILYHNKKWYPLKDEILDNISISDFCISEKGAIWFTSNKGIVRYYSGKFQLINKKFGLVGRSYTTIAYNDEKDLVYCSNQNGVSIFSDQEVSEQFQFVDTNFVINELYIDDSLFLLPNFKTVPSDYEEIKINYSVLNFAAFNNTNVEFRINESAWESTNNGQLRIKNLIKGKHTLIFRASNSFNDYIYSAPLEFIIRSKWYQTPVFYILCTVAFLLLVGLISRRIIRSYQQAAKDKIKLNNKIAFLEQRALAASMNPHFIFNVLNSIQDFVQKKSVLETNHYIAKFGNIIRRYLEVSEKPIISLQEELDLVKLYLELEKLRFGNDFSYAITIGDTIEDDAFLIPSMIIQPYVENAIKHGIRPKGSGLIQIKCTEVNDQLVIEIIDDGVGYDAEVPTKKSITHLNIATKVTKERIELFGTDNKQNGHVRITSSIGQGTHVKIVLPIVI